MRVYADSSFIVSVYHREPRTTVAFRQLEDMQNSGDTVLVSELVRLEVLNALRLGVFRKSQLESKADELIGAFEANIKVGAFLLVPPQVRAWAVARELSGAHTASTGCRSLDILHVAMALTLNAESFLTFDQRQRSLALAAGLHTPDLTAADHS